MYRNQLSLKKDGACKYVRAISSFPLPSIVFSICRRFCALLGISERTLQAQLSSASNIGARAEDRRNANRQAHNALTQMQRDTVVQLVLRVAYEEGISNPRFSFTEDSDAAPVRNFVHLPPHYSSMSLYYRYASLVFEDSSSRAFGWIFALEELFQE